MAALLTKSAYLKGRQCHRRLWLWAQHVPEADAESEPEAFQRFMEEQALAVERHAQTLFPGGELVLEPCLGTDETREVLEFDVHEPRTRELLSSGIPALFQAPLRAAGLAAVCDVLERRGEGWFIYEVKASTERAAIFDYDLAFQWILMEAAGFQVEGSGLIYLDRRYIHPGGDVEPGRLLIQEDRTSDVSTLLDVVRREIEEEKR